MKPIVAVTRRLPEAVEQRLARDYQARFNPDDRILTRDETLALLDGADGLVCMPSDKVDRALIDAFPKTVRILASYSVGLDHIDLPYAAGRDLVVTNTPDVLTEATAEVAMLCMLGAARRAHEGACILREGRWTGWTATQLLGTGLNGKRLGIIGMGRIGTATARRAVAFGMTILYHGRRPVVGTLGFPATFLADLDSLLAQSDVLSLHLPAVQGQPPLLDAARLAKLPRGAILVNTARGALIDDEALIAALTLGHIAAAGLDVFANEPKLHPGYIGLPNTFLLPHMGSATLETRNAMGFRVCDNLDAFFAGKEPPHRAV
jgi:lactate dehydrogenase-like 2-hydroxyacid dehydrogenase